MHSEIVFCSSFPLKALKIKRRGEPTVIILAFRLSLSLRRKIIVSVCPRLLYSNEIPCLHVGTHFPCGKDVWRMELVCHWIIPMDISSLLFFFYNLDLRDSKARRITSENVFNQKVLAPCFQRKLSTEAYAKVIICYRKNKLFQKKMKIESTTFIST